MRRAVHVRRYRGRRTLNELCTSVSSRSKMSVFLLFMSAASSGSRYLTARCATRSAQRGARSSRALAPRTLAGFARGCGTAYCSEGSLETQHRREAQNPRFLDLDWPLARAAIGVRLNDGDWVAKAQTGRRSGLKATAAQNTHLWRRDSLLPAAGIALMHQRRHS